MKIKILAMNLKRVVDLTNITTKTTESGTINLVEDGVFEIKTGSLISRFADNQKIFFGQIEIKKLNVLEEGIIGVPNLEKFEKLVKLFDPTDEIEMGTMDGKIYLKREMPYKFITYPTINPDEKKKVADEVLNVFQMKDDILQGKTLTWKSYFVILSHKFSDLLKDCETMGGTLIFPIKFSENEVKFLIEDEASGVKIDRNLEVSQVIWREEKKEIIEGEFTYAFDGLLSKIDGKLKVRMTGKNLTMVIERLDDGDGISCLYLVPSYIR